MIVTNNYKRKSKRLGVAAPKVLLVEDEPIFQELHFLLLEELNCDVEMAVTGHQALASAIHHYDIIFMDIGLPDIRGTSVITQIRASNFITKETPIIVLTAYKISEVEEECLMAKATAVLNKPVTSEMFKTVLKKYIIKR